IVTSTRNAPVLTRAEKFCSGRCAVARGVVSIRLAVEGNCWHSNWRLICELSLYCVVRRISRRKAEPMTVGVDHHIDVVRIVECSSGSLESFVGESPRWRIALPDYPRNS